MEEVCPLVHRYEYVGVPPDGVDVALPLQSALQLTFVDVKKELNAVGSVILNEEEEVQPLLSVTVVVYIPTHRLLMVLFVLPLLHW